MSFVDSLIVQAIIFIATAIIVVVPASIVYAIFKLSKVKNIFKKKLFWYVIGFIAIIIYVIVKVSIKMLPKLLVTV